MVVKACNKQVSGFHKKQLMEDLEKLRQEKEITFDELAKKVVEIFAVPFWKALSLTQGQRAHGSTILLYNTTIVGHTLTFLVLDRKAVFKFWFLFLMENRSCNLSLTFYF